jgi:hypothetical protein
VVADVGYAYGDRWYRHTEPSTGELRTYTAVRLHGVVANLVVYPAQPIGLPIWRDVGITFSYARAFGVDSRLAGATVESSQAQTAGGITSTESRGPFSTTYQRWDIGVRYRFPTAPRADSWRFGAGAGYRQWQFDFDVADEPDREVPRARYSLARVSFDVERWFGRFAVRGLLGYLPFLGSVTLGDRASQSFAQGAELSLGAAFAIVPMLRVRACGTYGVFRFPLMPLAGRNDEPGVVWDHYLTLAAGVEFAY